MRLEELGAEKVSVVLTMDDRLRGRQVNAMTVWIESWVSVIRDVVSVEALATWIVSSASSLWTW
jgi:hypothetical protein